MLCGDREMIQVLIEAGAEPNHETFCLGCMMGPTENMAAFLDNAPGFNINGKKSMIMMGNSAMHNVCMFGDAALQATKLQLLLERGAAPSVHTRNLMGFTPLSCLASNPDASPECVKILVDAGAKLD